MAAALFLSAPALAGGAYTWLVPWDAAAPSSLDACFAQVNPFVYAFDGRGRPLLLSPGLLQLAARARARGAKMIPVVVNDVQDRSAKRGSEKNVALLTALLNTDALVDKHVDELMAKVVTPDADGLELDYERIPAALYPRFERLVERLAARLHAQHKTLSVDLELGPFLKRGGPGREYFPRLAKSADQLNMMMYYERGEWTDAVGPGASLAWFSDAAKQLAAALPPQKLALVVSLAGTDWQVPYPRDPLKRRVKRLHYGQVVELMRKVGARPQWSDEWQAPYFEYEEAGRRHQVFFEDERSVAAKFEAARAVGAGVGLWYLGRAHPDLSSLGLCRR